MSRPRIRGRCGSNMERPYPDRIRKSRGLMETARARTSTSRGFRSGTGTPCLTSSTSGPPKRGTTTARQLFSAAVAVDAGRPPATRRRAITALHHIALQPRH
uniref:Uncharacterized protein n=1 Tax=Arundo donax TaxID=35708 RepID=A0A0A9CMH9_ARUDO